MKKKITELKAVVDKIKKHQPAKCIRFYSLKMHALIQSNNYILEWNDKK